MRRFWTLTLIATVAGCNSDSSTGPDRPVTGVAVTPATSSVTVGQTVTLVAKVTGGFSNPRITWESSNLNIATVTDSGVVTTKAVGSVTISATSGGVAGTATITITAVPPPPTPTIIVAPGTGSLIVGQTLQLGANVTNANTSSPTIVWSTSNASIATVSQTGLVTAGGAGTAVITAASSGVSANSTITITNGTVDRVSVCDRSITGQCNAFATLAALNTSVVVRASAFNTFGAEIASACVFAWVPNSVGVVSVTLSTDTAKRDALMTRTGYGATSVIVTCSGLQAVFTIAPLAAPVP